MTENKPFRIESSKPVPFTGENDLIHNIVRNDDDVVVCQAYTLEQADMVLTALNAYVENEQ